MHFICHSVCQCQCQCGAVLQRPCQLWLPHRTPALYRLGAGPLRGVAAATGLVTSLSGNLHLLGKLSPRRALSSCFLPLRRQSRWPGDSYLLSQKEDERTKFNGKLFLSNYSSITYIWRSCSVTGCLSHTGMTRRGRLDLCLKTSVIFLKTQL